MRPWRHTALALVAALLTACGGGGGDGPTNPNPNPTPGTLTVALSSSSGSLVAGNLVSVGVTITRGGSFSGAVTLEATGAPAGVTAGFTTASLAAGVTTSTLNVQTTSAAAPGTYPITVRASGTGVTTATTVYTLTVTAAPVPTVSIEVSNNAPTLPAGESRQVDVTITRGGGFTGPVSLAVTGLPTGVTATVTPNPVAGTTGTITLTAAAGAAATTGTLTVRGTAAGVTDATASIALTVTGPQRLTLETATPAVTIAQGAQSPGLPISITRENLTGNVALSVTAPTGITATVTPNPATGASTQVVIAVAPTVAPGQVPVVITGLLGGRSASVTFQVTVIAAASPDYGLSLSPAALTLTAGASISTTVNVTRSGGFTGAVTLGTSALPAGVTATFTPASVTGASAQLQLQSSGSTPAGTYQIAVLGTATGITGRQTNLTLVVQAPSGGTGNVTWQFCDASRFPIWFAFRDGTSGAWTRVLPGANQTYSFTMNDTRGGVTYVFADGGADFDVTTFYLTRDELRDLGAAECVNNRATKTINGTVAGLGAGQTGTISVGSGSGTAAVNGPVSITNVDDGTVDMIAVRAAIDIGTLSTTPDRLVLRRNLNIANNGTLPLVDFGSAEAFAPATATYTIANGGADQVAMVTGFSTSNGTAGFFSYGPLAGAGGGARTVYGVPSARTQAGDLQFVQATAIEGTVGTRIVAQYNRELANRTLTLGPALNAPTITTLGASPYPRLRAAGNWQADYNQGNGITFTQMANGGRTWSISSSFGYTAGAAGFELEIPDVTSASGFNTTWALQGGSATNWAVSASRVENAPIGAATEGFRFRAASRQGSVTP